MSVSVSEKLKKGGWNQLLGGMLILAATQLYPLALILELNTVTDTVILTCPNA